MRKPHIILRDIKITGFNDMVLNDDNDLIIIGHWQTTPFECYGTNHTLPTVSLLFLFVPPSPFHLFLFLFLSASRQPLDSFWWCRRHSLLPLTHVEHVVTPDQQPASLVLLVRSSPLLSFHHLSFSPHSCPAILSSHHRQTSTKINQPSPHIFSS